MSAHPAEVARGSRPERFASVHTPNVFDRIDLQCAHRIASGSERHIYEHPVNPALLVKVINVENYAAYLKKRRVRRWYKQFQRDSIYRVYMDELNEYIAGSAQRGADGRVPIARVLGLIDTTDGLGLMVEKIIDADGGLAPTVASIAKAGGWNATLKAQLDVFFEALCDAHVVLNEVSPANIAYGWNAHGKHGLFLIDGFGCKQALPVYTWSKRLNRNQLMRKYERSVAKLNRLYGDYRERIEALPEPDATAPLVALQVNALKLHRDAGNAGTRAERSAPGAASDQPD